MVRGRGFFPFVMRKLNNSDQCRIGTALDMMRTVALSLSATALLGTPLQALPRATFDFPTASIEIDQLRGKADFLDPEAFAVQRALADTTRNNAARDDSRDQAALIAFYAARDYKPVWVNRGTLTSAARTLVTRLDAARDDGLDPADYPTPLVGMGSIRAADSETAALAELQLSRSLLRYVRDAYAGRVDPASISSNITYKRHVPDPVEALTQIANASDPARVLGDFNPAHPGYLALRARLVETMAETDRPEPVIIPEGSALRKGDSDPQVVLLRQRLDITAPAENAALFDDTVDEAVRAFQDANGLTVDGIVGNGTRGALNGAGPDLQAELIANMERWRWLPRDLGAFHVFVNIPEFRLWVIKEEAAIHTTRVVVGKTNHQTPVFSDEMEHVVVNPYWNVPVSIVSKEMLPRIQSDPSYLVRANYEVLARVSGRMQVVDPAAIDWSSVSSRNMPRIRQRPGAGNALGNIKFMFPNQHSVYLHDTSSRSLFSRSIRAFSHGCVRVENPFDFADAVLRQEEGWSGDRVRRMMGGSERTIILDRHIPVHIGYFTLRVDDNGTVIQRPDLYGHQARVKAALGL